MSELKSVYIDRTGDWVRSGNDTGNFYLKDEADRYIVELKDAQRWRKCSEELPEEYVEVLFTDGNGYFAIGDMWILPGYDGRPDEQYWSGRGEPRCEDVKYWMPLPKAPKEDK